MRITKRVTIFLWSLTALLLFFSISYTIYLMQKKLVINLNPNSYTITAYSDSDDIKTRCSQVTSFVNKPGSVEFSYVLDTMIKFPYAGFSIALKGNSELNLDFYDTVVVKVDPKACNDFTLTMKTPLKDFSKPENPNTWRSFEFDYKVLQDQSTYSIPIEKFITPNWWYLANNLDSKQFPEQDLHNVTRFLVQNHPNLPRHQEFSIALQQISFKKSLSSAKIPWILTVIMALLALVFRPQRVSNIPYHQLDVENLFTEETKVLVDFLAQHYNNTELTLMLTSSSTNLSEKKIRKLLNDNFHKSFKQYLTDIRMVEAKRILKETDRSVSEVALLVGYSHTPTFTRNFRTQFGKLPSKYRKG